MAAIDNLVSIHAPARGAILDNAISYYTQKFQFTHPQGVRLRVQAEVGDLVVSIHAPARGAMLGNFCKEEL